MGAIANKLPVMQDHEIDVAVRIEFRTPITANRRKRQLRKFLLSRLGKIRFGGVPKIAQENVKNRGSTPANMQPASPGPMKNFEPMRFDLEESLISRQFLRRQATRWQSQPRGRVGFNLLEQFLHLEISLGINDRQRKCG